MSAVRTTDKYERTFTLAVPPERAWRAFTEPREMEAWFRDRVHEFDARPGGRVRYEMVGITVEGVVEEARPHRLLRWTAGPGLLPGPTVISVSFERVGGGTQITITQSGFGDGDEWLTELEDHALGWNQLITDLSLYLGTGALVFRCRLRRLRRCRQGARRPWRPGHLRSTGPGVRLRRQCR